MTSAVAPNEPQEMDVRKVTFMNYLGDIVEKETPSLSWSDVSKEFLIFFKDFVERTEDDFEKLSGKVHDLREEWEITRIYRFVVEKVMSFDNFPFTWRRFCELLYDPLKNYKKMLPFMRALERVINVRTTISSLRSPSEDTFFSEFIFLKVDSDFGEKFDMSDPMKGSVVADEVRFYPDESNMGYTRNTSDNESADAAVSVDDNAVCDQNLSEMGNGLHHSDPFQEDNIDTFLHCENEIFCTDFFFVPLSEIYAEGTVEIVSEEYADA